MHRAQGTHRTDVEATAGGFFFVRFFLQGGNAILCPCMFLLAGFNYLHSAAGVMQSYLANTLQLEQVVSVWFVEMFATVSLQPDFIRVLSLFTDDLSLK